MSRRHKLQAKLLLANGKAHAWTLSFSFNNSVSPTHAAVSLFSSGLMFSPQKCAGPSWVKLIKEYSGEVKPSDLSNEHRH